jgi:hypothetical protein
VRALIEASTLTGHELEFELRRTAESYSHGQKSWLYHFDLEVQYTTLIDD